MKIGRLRLDSATFLTFLAVAVAGCSTTPIHSDGVYDPYEPTNRAIHGFNKGADSIVLRPASQIYAAVTPDPVELMVFNVVSNLSLPSDIVNHALQGDFHTSMRMTGRFLVNSTIGFLGFFDPASTIDLADDSTDFGATLHRWGVDEGPFVELPLLGPSTTRDASGRAVDFLLNPLGYLVPSPEIEVTYALRGLEVLGSRHRLSAAIDPTLYEAEDSYAAARIGYLLNRRNTLQGGVIIEDDLDDPFAFDE